MEGPASISRSLEGTGGSPAGEARTIDGMVIAKRLEAEVARQVLRLRSEDVIPHLATVQIGQDPATDLYITRQKRLLGALGIQFTHLSLDPGTSDTGVLAYLDALNANPTITGIMVTSPIPEALSSHRIREAILPEKDVEGLTSFNLGNLIYDDDAIGPCTAVAVLHAIDSTGIELEGCRAVVVGHSDTVGKPVTLCLLRRMATTTTCHVATRDLARETRAADLLVVAVGKPGLIGADMVKPGAVVIDVGINEVPRAPGDVRQTRIVGDVRTEEVARHASWITPVPGGIGPITVAVLGQNTVLCAERQRARRDR